MVKISSTAADVQIFFSTAVLTLTFDLELSKVNSEIFADSVPERITYKLCVLLYNCLHGTAPQHLQDIISLLLK